MSGDCAGIPRVSDRCSERFTHDPFLLQPVCARVALARARPPGPADVPQRHALGERLLEAVPDRAEGSHVQAVPLAPRRALVAPGKRRSTPRRHAPGTGTAAPAERSRRAERRRAARRRRRRRRSCGAQHEAGHSLAVDGFVVQDGRERTVGERREACGGVPDAKEPFGHHHDQGLGCVSRACRRSRWNVVAQTGAWHVQGLGPRLAHIVCPFDVPSP
jgi:hypothetical protein